LQGEQDNTSKQMCRDKTS